MWKIVLILCLTTIIAAPVENLDEDDTSIEIPIKPHRSQQGGFSLLNPNDDVFFGFVKKILDTAHLSSRMAVRRIQKDNEQRKSFREEIGDILTNEKIPILDDLPKLF